MNCLNTIVGLSNTDCSCLEINRPGGYETSLSGFFIDDVEFSVPLEFANSLQDCERGGLWDMLASARTKGIANFINDYNLFLGQNAKERHRKYRGKVAIDTTKALSGNGYSYYGAKLFSQGHKGTVFKITSIGLKLTGSETVTIDVSGTDVEITTTANTISRATLENPIELELTDGLGVAQDHVISYQASSLPYKNPIYCNCSGKRPPFEDFAQFRGFRGDTAAPEDSDLSRNIAYGLIIDGVFECNALDWLCDDDVNYTTNPHARLMARTLQLHQINSLLKAILSSTRINRYTMLEGENIASKIEQNYMLIQHNMEWFANNLPYDLQSCYVCRPSGQRKFLKV